MEFPAGWQGRLTTMALLSLSLAGCSASPETSATPVGPAATQAVIPSVSWLNGTYTDVRDSGLVESTAGKVLRFNVTDEATFIVVELGWEDPDAAVDLYVYAGRFCDGSSGPPQACSWLDWWTFGGQDGSFVAGGPGEWDGASYRRLEIAASDIAANQCGEPECTWRAVVGSELMVNTPFWMAASVFTGGPSPTGYSAFQQ